MELLVKYLILLALFFVSAADAQTAAVTAVSPVTFTPPTTDTLGAPLTGASALIKSQLFVGTATIPDTAVTPTVDNISPSATSVTYTTTVPNGSTLFFRLRSCNAICSALSAQVSKPIAVSVPNAPTGVGVTVTVTVNVSP